MTIKTCPTCKNKYDSNRCMLCLDWEYDGVKEINKIFSPRILNDLKTIQIPKVIKQDVNWLRTSGNHFYLMGDVGTGKTLYAAMLTYESIHRQFFEEKREGAIVRHLFISVSDLLQNIKASFSIENSQESVIIKKYSEIDWLVLDDFGIEKTSDWALQVLYLIVNHRYEYMRTTIFTSNLNLEGITNKLGDGRIPSRIKGMCKIRVFNEKDMRVKKQ
jgi:DNA replication protein DnaC